MMSDSDSVLRRALRACFPKVVRGVYWRMWSAVQRRRMERGQVHERAVCVALEGLIKPGDICLDVGANVGLLTVFMAKLSGATGRVHAFELHPDNIKQLRGNIKACGLSDRTTVTHAAVSDGSVDEVTFYAGRNRSNAEWNITGEDANGAEAVAVATVAAVALDDRFSGQDRIDFVKIDVEGAESAVLIGMERILREQNPALLIECHTADNWRACAKLVDLGYTLEDVRGKLLDPADDYPASHLVARPVAKVCRQAA